MNYFKHQNLVNAQKQEAFILDETRKDKKIVNKKWKKERTYQIIAIIVVLMILFSLMS